MLTAPFFTQLNLRPGVFELNWGQPDPRLLPIEAVKRATVAVLAQTGAEALSYGREAGAETLRTWIKERVERTEGQSLTAEELVITAGNSDALDQICSLFTQPGDVALVESPTYHLALEIMKDHPLTLECVPMDAEGLRVDLLAEKVRALKTQGRVVRMVYTIPTYHNPTGVCLSPKRRRALIELAVAEDFLIVEDDVYRELAYDGPAPASLWSLAPRGTVLRLGSFAKSLAPGLRLGWLNGSPAQIDRVINAGLRVSGGGVNHFTGMVVGYVCQNGEFDQQIELFKTTYRQRREALHETLTEHLPKSCQWVKQGGGYFIWVTLPEGLDARQLLARAEEHGVAYTPGVRFHLDGRGSNTMRLAFSLYTPAELTQAAERLGKALRGIA